MTDIKVIKQAATVCFIWCNLWLIIHVTRAGSCYLKGGYAVCHCSMFRLVINIISCHETHVSLQGDVEIIVEATNNHVSSSYKKMLLYVQHIRKLKKKYYVFSTVSINGRRYLTRNRWPNFRYDWVRTSNLERESFSLLLSTGWFLKLWQKLHAMINI